MKILTLLRFTNTDQGTPGVLTGEELELHTLELPYRDNLPTLSCIPRGTYRCKAQISPHHGRVIALFDVPGRANILIHAGNFAGNVAKGWKADSQGCILVGLEAEILAGQNAVVRSRDALGKLLDWAGDEELSLTVQGGM